MFRFYDRKVDTQLFLQLQDLATVLSGKSDLTFAYDFGSKIDMIDNTITVSRFWDNLKTETKEAGLKSEIYLRAIGTFHYTDVLELKRFWQKIEASNLLKFASQLITLLEDIRLEEIIKKERPGTKKAFDLRKNYYKHFFTSQLAANVTRSYALDELFCLIYLLIQAEEPDPLFPRANESQLRMLEKLKPILYATFEAKTTKDVIHIAATVMETLARQYEDSFNEYFIFPIAQIGKMTAKTLFDDLTRTDPLANDDMEELDEEKSEFIDEKFSTWHRENKNEERKQTFLQYELEQGTKTSLLGGEARQTETGDQAQASIQGSSGKSKENDYSKLELVEKKPANDKGNRQNGAVYGELNRHAVKLVKEATAPTLQDIQLYNAAALEIEPFKRKLATSIEKSLEHKKNEPRNDLLVGRLSRKLLPLVIEQNRRIFYKKNNDNKEIDAVFTLLVDCSASMYNKMDETKKGIVLFHEVLQQLKIPHAIIGFWEDATAVKEDYQPNYFHMIHFHSDSFYEHNGAKIMQLEPEEDNRDGFSIRVAAEDLLKRQEKHKFLLVFSDGEPAASGYDQDGIVDTHHAVADARKKGIDVIGMYLTDGSIDKQEDALMKNIYGKERLMIQNIAELPEHFAPLLKKLLLKTI